MEICLIIGLSTLSVWLLWGYFNYSARQNRLINASQSLLELLDLRHKFAQELFCDHEYLVEHLHHRQRAQFLREFSAVPANLDSTNAVDQENALARALGEAFEEIDFTAHACHDSTYLKLRDRALQIEDRICHALDNFNTCAAAMNLCMQRPPIILMTHWFRLKLNRAESVVIEDALRYRRLTFPVQPLLKTSRCSTKLREHVPEANNQVRKVRKNIPGVKK